MNIRTDLAMEAREALGGDAPRGVTQQIFQRNGFCLTRVEIQTKEGAEILGKPVGTYTTIEHASLCNADDAQRDVCAALLTQELRAMLPENVDRGCVLVVGLGNRRVTPDSLGPCAAGHVFVTRHMIEALQITSLEGVPLQNVCSLSPGVLGVTGIETELVVKSLCRSLRPSCVICIDSLASMKTSRLLSTVQLSDSGISPGSGVGNHNAALDSDSACRPSSTPPSSSATRAPIIWLCPARTTCSSRRATSTKRPRSCRQSLGAGSIWHCSRVLTRRSCKCDRIGSPAVSSYPHIGAPVFIRWNSKVHQRR